MDGSNISLVVAADELRSIIERVEQLRSEIADRKELEKEIWADAKGRGYMTRPLRTIIKERAQNPDDLAEAAAVLEMYKAALGMPT